MKRWSFYRSKEVREVLSILKEDYNIGKEWIVEEAEKALSEVERPRKGELEVTLWSSGDYNFPEYLVLHLYPYTAGRGNADFDAEIFYVRQTNLMGDEHVVPIAFRRV